MPIIGVVVAGDTETAAALLAAGEEARLAAGTITEHYGELLRTTVQEHASGRPGPEIQTGEYRASISKDTIKAADETMVEVYSEQPQGMRLEFGFVGTDSIGRTYHQPPFPHFGPALDEIAGPFEDAISAMVAGL